MAEEAIASEERFFASGGADVPAELSKEAEQPQTDEQPTTEQPQEKPKQEDNRTVPLAALHEERARRKEERERAEKMEQRFQQLLEKLGPQAEQPKIPDFEAAPADHLKAGLDATQKELAEFKKWRDEQSQQSWQAQQHHQFVQTYASAAQEFAAKQTDFPLAYKHLMADRDAELQELGFVDAANRHRILQAEEQGIVAQALQNGKNPAEVLYAVAKRRGFKGGAGTAEDAETKIETLRKGANASNPTAGGGGNAEPPMSLEALARMSDEDFDKNWDKIMKPPRRRG